MKTIQQLQQVQPQPQPLPQQPPNLHKILLQQNLSLLLRLVQFSAIHIDKRLRQKLLILRYSFLAWNQTHYITSHSELFYMKVPIYVYLCILRYVKLFALLHLNF